MQNRCLRVAGLAAIALAVRWVRNGYETYAVRAAPASLCQKSLELSPAASREVRARDWGAGDRRGGVTHFRVSLNHFAGVGGVQRDSLAGVGAGLVLGVEMERLGSIQRHLAARHPRPAPSAAGRKPRVVVTGLNGRIGASMLVDPVLAAEYELVGFNRRPMEGVESFTGDISDLAAVEAALQGADGAARPPLALHPAASAHHHPL